MATPSTVGMNAAWGFYRQCAATAAFQKSELERFTRISLWLGIAGAVIGTVSQFVAPDPALKISKVLGVIASLMVALAGLAATQATSGSRDKVWIKCRAAAEALKSAVYLYCASAPPFDDRNRAVTLAALVEKTTKDLTGIELRPGTEKQPPGPLTVDAYIRDRLDDQLKYYNDTANKFQNKADFWRNCTLGAAALSVALGTVSAITSLSPWVALLAIVTASVTAYVKNQRYESMIGLYQMTAVRLRALKDQWLDSGKTDADKAERDSLIRRCEDILSLENGAWLAQWSQTPPQLPPPPASPKLDSGAVGAPAPDGKGDAAPGGTPASDGKGDAAPGGAPAPDGKGDATASSVSQ